MFFDKKKEKSKKLTKEEKLAKAQEDSAKNENLIKKLEKRIKNQNSKKEKVEARKNQKEIKKIEKNQKKLEREEEKRKKVNKIFAFSEDKKKKKQKINTADPIYNKDAKQTQQRPTVLSNLKQQNENEHKENAIKSFYENKKSEKTAAPVIKPQVEVKPKEETPMVKQPAAPAKQSTKAVYINPLTESPQQKQASHFDFATGKRVAGTQKERTQDM